MPRGIRTARVRAVRPYAKLKWSPVFGRANFDLGAQNAGGGWVNQQTIVATAAAQGGVIPPVTKVRHVKARMTIPQVETAGQITNIMLALVFKPQSIDQLTNDMLVAHPEWIMGYTTGIASTSQSTTIAVSSPLSRNLNSGDSIVIFFTASNTAGPFNGTICYASWTASVRTN